MKRYIIIGWARTGTTREIVYWDGYDWCHYISEARIYEPEEEMPPKAWLHTSEVERVFKMAVSFGKVEEV